MTMLNDNLFWDKMSLSAFLSHAENEAERTAMILTNSEVSLGDKMIAGLMKQIQFVKPDSDRRWLYGCLWLLIRFMSWKHQLIAESESDFELIS